MIPLVGSHTELKTLRVLAERTISNVKKRKKFRGNLKILIGTMIEVPRAALTANEVGKDADFFRTEPQTESIIVLQALSLLFLMFSRYPLID